MRGSAGQEQAAARVDVLLVTSIFPAPSEAFAGVEVRALERAGACLRVRAMRTPHPLSGRLLSELQLTRTDVTHLDVASYLRGLTFLARHPLMSLRALCWVVFNGWRTPGPTIRCLLLLPRLLDIFSECLRHPPDVLYLYWGHYPAVVGYMAKRFAPQVHVSVGLFAFDLIYRFGPGLVLADEADTLWTLAECNIEQIRALGVENPRLAVLFHGVDLSEVPGVSQLRDKRRGQIVTIARLVKNKGVDDSLRVLAIARRSDPSLTLTVIGEGEERAVLEQLAGELGVRDSVTFLGPRMHAEVYEQLASADVLLLMSRNPSERLPNVIKEAMACRCICVVTESPGIDELVGTLANDCVVAQGDWARGAELIVDIMKNPECYEADRDAGREHVMEMFDASRIAERRIAAWMGGPAPCDAIKV